MTLTPSHDIEALAEKAIEAEKAFKNLPHGASIDATELALAMRSFGDAATPKAWLALSQKNRELEQALKEARGKALEEAAKVCETERKRLSDCFYTANKMNEVHIADLYKMEIRSVERLLITIRALNTHPDKG